MEKIFVKPAQEVIEVRSAFLFAASSFDLNQSTMRKKMYWFAAMNGKTSGKNENNLFCC